MAKNRFSGVTTRRQQQPEERINNRKADIDEMSSIDEIGRYMEGNYGMTLDRATRQYDLDSMKTYMKAAIDMFETFPELKGQMKTFGSNDNLGRNSYAAMDLNGNLFMQYSKMKDLETAQGNYDEDIRKGFHPKGTNAACVVVHEMGHALEAILVKRRFPEDSLIDRLARNEAWRKCKIANEIVSSALDKTTPGWRRNKLATATAIRGISGYATANKSEALAEAISDYYANGSNANPLSQAIVQEVTRRLRS